MWTIVRPILALAVGLLGLLGLLGRVSAAAAQDAPEVTLDVQAGYDGVGKAGRWLPVRVTVANEGPGFEGDVRLLTGLPTSGGGAAYSQPINLPGRSRKLVQLAAPAPPSARDLRVELVRPDGEAASRDVPVRLLGPSDFLVGVLADDDVRPAGLGSLRRGNGPITVARVGPGDLPTDPVALQALDALVVRNWTSSRLTAEQRSALRAWVETGGQLVVTGGPSWRRSTEGLDELLPIQGLGIRSVGDLRALQRYAGGPPPEGSLLLAAGTPVSGARTLLQQDGIPLIVERWLGQGRVTFLAADLGLEPFRSWPAAESVWQRILVGGRPFALGDEPSGGAFASQLRIALADLIDPGLPGPGWLAAWLLAYVACVGPLQYLVLRRIDRREWAWLGFPILALAFTALTYVGGSRLRGSEVRLGAVSVVRSSAGAATAPADTYVGLLVPTRRAYDVLFVDGLALRPLFGRGGPATDRALIRLGRPTHVPALRLESRTLQGFGGRAYGPAPTPIRSSLRAIGGRLEGLVTNGGPDRLDDAILLAGSEVLELGDVAPGEARPVSLALPTSRVSTGPSSGGVLLPRSRSPSGPQDARRMIVASLVEPARASGASGGGVRMLAWSGASAPRLTADGAPVPGAAARLLEQAVPVHYGDDTLVVPPGLMSRTVLEGAALSRPPNPSLAVGGPIVLQYDLPPGVAFARVDRLSVHLAYGYPTAAATAPPPRVSLFRWADRAWVDAQLGPTGVADVDAGGAFLDGGALRVRVEPHAPQAFLQQVDLSLEGAGE